MMRQRSCVLLILAASAFWECGPEGDFGVSGLGEPSRAPRIISFIPRALSPTIVEMTWQIENVFYVEKVQFERQNEAGAWQVIGEAVSSYVDYPLKPNTEYKYRIRAYGGDKGRPYAWSGYSEATGKTFANDGIWKEVDFPNRRMSTYPDAAFVDEQIGVAVGDDILRTTDGGLTWVRVFGDGSSAVDFEPGGFGVACGGNTASISYDGGASWSRQIMSSLTQNLSVDVVSKDVVYMLTNVVSRRRGIILKSLDGGRTWESKDSLLTVPNQSYQVYFVTGEKGVVVGTKETTLNPLILRTTDGGATLNDVSPISSVNTVGTNKKIHFFDEANGIASFGTHLFLTADEGQTWQAHSAIPDGQGWSFLNSQDVGFMVGISGRTWRTDNRGMSWQAETVPSLNSLWGVAFAGSKRVVAVGGFGTILVRNL